MSDRKSPACDLVRIVRATVALVMVLASPAFAGPDEKNLKQVVDYFYLPAQPLPTPEQRYAFLSSETRLQINQTQWKEMNLKQPRTISSVAILGQGKAGDRTYGVVSVTETIQGKRMVSTATWVLESGGWRRLLLPRHAVAISDYLQKKDHEAAINEAEAWRREDPFSVGAYSAVIVCKTRTGSALIEVAVDDLISDLLAINPDDTDSLLAAVTYTEDTEAAQVYLDKLKDTSVYEKAVDAYVANIRNREKAVIPVGEEEMLIQQLVILADLDNMAEFNQLSSLSNLWERLTGHLDRLENERAAGKAGRLGLAFYKAGNRPAAAKWLEYGKRRSPVNSDVRQLATILEKDTR